MRWPWSKRRTEKEAVAEARRAAADAKAKEHEASWLAARLREIRESDDFARLLNETFTDRRRR